MQNPVAPDISDHPDVHLLLRRVATLVARANSLREVVFRCSEPAYATKVDLLAGEGSRRYGGRWNPPSSFAIVYAAFSLTTALAEVMANHRYYGLNPADALPRTIVAVDVKLGRVLDLTDGAVRKTLGVSATRMRGDDWRKLNRHGAESLTQAIGRAAYENDLEALIVPACDGGSNIVWFPGNLQATSQATIRNVNKLD
jgi:RES domain-containing protein